MSDPLDVRVKEVQVEVDYPCDVAVEGQVTNIDGKKREGSRRASKKASLQVAEMPTYTGTARDGGDLMVGDKEHERLTKTAGSDLSVRENLGVQKGPSHDQEMLDSMRRDEWREGEDAGGISTTDVERDSSAEYMTEGYGVGTGAGGGGRTWAKAVKEGDDTDKPGQGAAVQVKEGGKTAGYNTKGMREKTAVGEETAVEPARDLAGRGQERGRKAPDGTGYVATQAMEGGRRAADQVGDMASQAVEGGRKMADQAENVAGQALQSGKRATDQAGAMGGQAMEGGRKVADQAENVGSQAVESGKRVTDQAGDMAGQAMEGGRKVADQAENVASQALQSGKRATDQAGDMAGQAMEGGRKVADQAGDMAGQAMEGGRQAAEQAGAFAQQTLEDGRNVAGQTYQAVSAGGEKAVGLGQAVAEGAHNRAGQVADMAMEGGRTVAGLGAEATRQVVGTGTDALEAGQEVVDQAVESGASAASQAAEGGLSMASQMVESGMDLGSRAAQSGAEVAGATVRTSTQVVNRGVQLAQQGLALAISPVQASRQIYSRTRDLTSASFNRVDTAAYGLPSKAANASYNVTKRAASLGWQYSLAASRQLAKGAQYAFSVATQKATDVVSDTTGDVVHVVDSILPEGWRLDWEDELDKDIKEEHNYMKLVSNAGLTTALRSTRDSEVHGAIEGVIDSIGQLQGGLQDLDSVLHYWALVYTAKTEAEQYKALLQGYADEATFEDNLVKATGLKEVATQFYAFRLMFDHIEVLHKGMDMQRSYDSKKYSCAVKEYEITHKLKLYLHRPLAPVTKYFLPTYIPLWMTTTLVVRQDDGKILAHRDHWHNVPGLPRIIRKMLGESTSRVMIDYFKW